MTSVSNYHSSFELTSFELTSFLEPEKASYFQDEEEKITQAIHTFSTEPPDGNLVLRFDRLQAIEMALLELQEMAIAKGLKEQFEPIKHRIKEKLLPYQQTLSEREKELKLQKEWLKLKWPQKYLSTHPDCVKFLMQSDFAYSIVLFNNSTGCGRGNHSILEGANGEPMVKMNGEYRSWQEIKELLVYSEEMTKVVLRSDSNVAYNYISPDGIVQKDPTPNELYPIAQLNQEEYLRLMAHAKTFWEGHDEVDPGQEKECILQIVTTRRDNVPQNWLTEPINDVFPAHTFLRLIDKDGSVYSFSIMATKETYEFTSQSPMKFLASGYAKVKTPDYAERYNFPELEVTSIPLVTKRLKAIFEFTNGINQAGGMRFCFSKQNCNKFGVLVASLAGVRIDTRTQLGEMVWDLLPDLKKIPVIGEPLSSLRDTISSLVAPIFKAIETYTPEFVKRAFTVMSDGLFFVPRKIKTVFLNLLLYYFLGGGEQAVPLRPGDPDEAEMDDARMTTFSTLIRSWQDLLIDEKSEFDQSYKIRRWQKNQRSTVSYSYDGTPQMYMHPPVIYS